MEEDRMPKKVFTQELEGTRRRGRPRKGWREEVERDLQVLGVRRWRELVIDRERWRGIVRQAKAHSGLWRQWKTKKKKCVLRKILIISTCLDIYVKSLLFSSICKNIWIFSTYFIESPPILNFTEFRL
jgi:hypothetical protein